MTPMAPRKEHRDGSDGTQPGGSVVPDVAKRMGIYQQTISLEYSLTSSVGRT